MNAANPVFRSSSLSQPAMRIRLAPMRVAGKCQRKINNAGVPIELDRDPDIRHLLLLQPQRDACDELPSEQIIPHHGIAAEQPDPRTTVRNERRIAVEHVVRS